MISPETFRMHSIEIIIERQKGSPIDNALEEHFGRSGRYVERKIPRPFCRLEGTSAILAYLKAINKEDLYHKHTHLLPIWLTVLTRRALKRVN
ncbi:hypothetical protein EVAR_54723_1 [Eumeta japonica]|uniref:Uncharacterized protein n=1 Tax=Eumeta variegata TaxID=151549 RepID=A0A4C1YLP5_EUMVA|nr:hypothetical protein EVAR_54723_1 [Eumeta japonica]